MEFTIKSVKTNQPSLPFTDYYFYKIVFAALIELHCISMVASMRVGRLPLVADL